MASISSCPVFRTSPTFTGKTCPAGFGPKTTGTERFTGYPGASPFESRWPTSFEGGNWGYPGTFGGFEGRNWGYPGTFGGFEGRNWNWPSNFTGFPSTFEGRTNWGWPSTFTGFGGYPWTNGTGYYPGWTTPSEWSRFGGNTWGYPGTFGGYTGGSLCPYANEWRFKNTIGNRFGGETTNFHNISFRPSHSVEYFSLTNPIRILDHEGNRCLWLCYELKGFKPEELIVTFDKKERAIIVEATHDIKEGKEHHVTRKFYRKFVLPDSLAKLDLTTVHIKSYFSPEGFLYIECSLPKMTAEELARYPSRWAHFNELPYRRSFHGTYENAYPITVKTA